MLIRTSFRKSPVLLQGASSVLWQIEIFTQQVRGACSFRTKGWLCKKMLKNKKNAGIIYGKYVS